MPSTVIALAYPLIAIPNDNYTYPWYGALGVLWLLGVTGSLSSLEGGVRQLVRRRREQHLAFSFQGLTATSARHLLRSLRVSLSAAGALVVVAVAVAFALVPKAAAVTAQEDRQYYINNATRLLRVAPNAVAVSDWAFSSARPPGGWLEDPGVTLRSAGSATVVTTNHHATQYQLQGPTALLPAGSYEAVVAGSVRHGGLALGVLDADADAWIATSLYASVQWPDTARLMVKRFTLPKPRRVEVILSNWRLHDGRSVWILRHVRLVRLPPS
jgi:hypothetical protein